MKPQTAAFYPSTNKNNTNNSSMKSVSSGMSASSSPFIPSQSSSFGSPSTSSLFIPSSPSSSSASMATHHHYHSQQNIASPVKSTPFYPQSQQASSSSSSTISHHHHHSHHGHHQSQQQSKSPQPSFIPFYPSVSTTDSSTAYGSPSRSSTLQQQTRHNQHHQHHQHYHQLQQHQSQQPQPQQYSTRNMTSSAPFRPSLDSTQKVQKLNMSSGSGQGAYSRLATSFSPIASSSPMPSSPYASVDHQHHHHATTTVVPPYASSSTPYRSVASFSMNEGLRQMLVNRTMLAHRLMTPSELSEMQVPTNVQHFHSLYPLDASVNIQNSDNQSKICNFMTEVYKAVNSMNGSPCVLRRIKAISSNSKTSLPSWEFANRYVDIWKQLKHPNIVGLQSLFSTSEFGASASSPEWVFVYDYFVGSESLEAHYSVNAIRAPPEPIMWSYICQIVSALKVIHASSLAYRALHSSKVLLLSSNRRIKLNCVGLLDVLCPVRERDAPEDQPLDEEQVDNIYYDQLAELQDQDIMDLGYLLLNLASKSNDAKLHVDKRLSEIENVYSEEFVDLVKYLVSEGEELKSIDDIINMIGSHYHDETVYLYEQNDYLEDELVKELDNGRLLRLLVKLNFAIQYAEEQQKYTNSDSGDLHVLLLFSDYLFKQVNSDGSPVIDYGHITETLNKLDAGTSEKLLLMSKDEQSLIVASFKELKRSVNQIFKFFFEL